MHGSILSDEKNMARVTGWLCAACEVLQFHCVIIIASEPVFNYQQVPSAADSVPDIQYLALFGALHNTE